MDPLATDSPGDQTAMTDEAWQSVLRAVDQTYSELVAHQERLEDQNAELSAAKRLIESVMASVSDILIVIDRDGTVAEASASLRGLVGGEAGAVIGQPATGVFDTAGAELLVLAGAFADEHGTYRRWSWLRIPPGGVLTPTGGEYCELYIKEGGFAYLREAA